MMVEKFWSIQRWYLGTPCPDNVPLSRFRVVLGFLIGGKSANRNGVLVVVIRRVVLASHQFGTPDAIVGTPS